MSKFIGRNKHNQICIDSLRLQVWLDDLFMECKTEKEIDFILENIVGYAEKCTHCNGAVYKLLTSLGIIYQCKYGATYQGR